MPETASGALWEPHTCHTTCTNTYPQCKMLKQYLPSNIWCVNKRVQTRQCRQIFGVLMREYRLDKVDYKSKHMHHPATQVDPLPAARRQNQVIRSIQSNKPEKEKKNTSKLLGGSLQME